MGTGEIGRPTLSWLADCGHELVGVFTQPDRPAGRGSKITVPPIKDLAQDLGVPIWQPERLRKSDELAELLALELDLIIVMAYGQILPKSVLEAPSVACLNLHASILPKYRGAAPIQAAILNGDTETGITVMHMAQGLDTGDIMHIERLPITADETGGSLHDKLAELGPTALLAAVNLIEAGKLSREPQDDALATHVGKLTRDDGRIDWSKPAVEIERQVRALFPWPGTTTTIPTEGKRAKVLKIHPPVERIEVTPHDAQPGAVLRADKSGLLIATGDSDAALLLKRVQPESKKVMEASAFLAGRPFAEGDGEGRLE